MLNNVRKQSRKLAAGRRSLWRAAPFGFAVVAVTMFTSLPVPTATAGTPTGLGWKVSNNQTGAASVVYSYAFTAATTGTIKTVTFAISGAGLGGTPTINHNFGLGAGTVARSGQTVTYTVTTAASVKAKTPIYLSFGGLTNTSTTGTYTTVVTTTTSAPATIDSGTTPSVAFGSSNTASPDQIANALTLTVSSTAFQLDLDPSLPALADQSDTVGLTVQTNANSGYTLTVADNPTGLQSGSADNPTIAPVSTGKAKSVAWPGAPSWGYTVTGTGATIDPAFSGSKYAGYTAAGETIASHAGPTGSTDTISIVNRVAITYSVPAGVYTDTLVYTVTPNYD